MQIGKPEFRFELTPLDIKSIRSAITQWKEDPSIALTLNGALLYSKFEEWRQIVDMEWDNWDTSEYEHDIGCRYWIQLAIENASNETAAALLHCAWSDDERFRQRMRPKRKPRVHRVNAFKSQPYFWELNTIHPEG